MLLQSLIEIFDYGHFEPAADMDDDSELGQFCAYIESLIPEDSPVRTQLQEIVNAEAMPYYKQKALNKLTAEERKLLGLE